jgi:CRISPR-associated endonuclease/helicase Cas3
VNNWVDDFDKRTSTMLLPWGKAAKDGTKWEPAILHMLTVGIVAKEMYGSLPGRTRRSVADGFGLDEKTFGDMLPIIASLHDLGKISPGHQLLIENLPCVTQMKSLGFSFAKNRDLNHKHVAFSYIKQALDHITVCTAGDGSSACIAYALAAHHGELHTVDSDRIYDDEQWGCLRFLIAEYITKVFGHKVSAQLKVTSLSSLLVLCGLTVLADWVGSSVEFFPYASATCLDDIDSFIKDCQDKACKSMSYLGLNARLTREFVFDSVFAGKSPNAAQQTAFKVAAGLTHPMLLIVLSSTGSGKTEIPLGLFARTAIREDLRGLYFALPTQGTASQNFQRLRDFADRLSFEGNPQLHLLHSAAEIDESYGKLKARVDDGSNGELGTVTASEWFSTTKKGLAATFGGGTVDQALLSVLRVKWMPLRFFALAGKMVVLDEIHSYDTYMTRSISRFLEWVPYIETSVVALSATLPQKAVKDLLKSFAPDADLPEVIPYPCVVGVDKAGAVSLIQIPVDDFRASATLSPLLVDGQAPLNTIIGKIRDLLPEEGNIAVIMNTITEAQDLAALIQQSEGLRDIELTVYHSRFTVADRAAIEQTIGRKYGKEGFTNGQRPRRSIVVATQVLEQSLDVDFDFMISWLAPIDLLLQRLGRLQRFLKIHPRSTDRILYVAMADIFSGELQFGLSGLVYFRDILQKTAMLFAGSKACQSIHLNLPEAASPLIEAVYGERDEDVITKWEEDRIGKQLGEIYLAEEHLLNHAHGEEGIECGPFNIALCLRNVSDETRISSRLADVSVTVILLSPQDRPTTTDGRFESALDLWKKSMPVRNRGLVYELLKEAPPPEWQNIPLLRNSRPLYLEKEGRLGAYDVTYDRVLGLQIGKSAKGE